jgi:tetratricopeptide (TPR) repeat protein
VSRFSQRKTQGCIKLVSWSITAAMTLGLLVSIPGEVTGQSQPPPSALEEPKRRNQRLEQFVYNKSEYSQDVSLAERALAIREKVLGKEHPSVASSLNNLAALYNAQGIYQKAEPLYLRSLAITEKALGKEDIAVARILAQLAELYKAQGSYQKAEPLESALSGNLRESIGQRTYSGR